MSLRWLSAAARARHGRLVGVAAPDGLRVFLHERLTPYFSTHPIHLEAASIGPLCWLTLADDVMVLPRLAFESPHL